MINYWDNYWTDKSLRELRFFEVVLRERVGIEFFDRALLKVEREIDRKVAERLRSISGEW